MENNEDDGREEYIETDPYMIELNKINEKYNLPLDKNVRLDDCVGKTIKYCNYTKNRKNNTILFVFTDETFLTISNEWDSMTDNVSFSFRHDEDYQNLMIDGGLISQEKVDEYNEYLQNKRDNAGKEQDLKILKNLLLKYPDYK